MYSKGNLLCLGDFNWPNIDWSTWTSTSKTGFEIKFVDTLRKNFLNQYVSKPTRARGDDHPHILDLVITQLNSTQPEITDAGV